MKRLLTLLLAVGMAVSLCACGDSGDSAPASDNPNDNPTASMPEENPSETTDPADTHPNYEEPIQTAPQESDSGSTEPTATAVEGLILMTTTDINFQNPQIYCVDIETGASELIADWDFRPRQGDTVNYYPGPGFRCGRQDWFADDYSKVAVSRTDSQSGQTCAGWLDADGNFFNVSEALGRVGHGDFDDPVEDYAVGFMDDEFFVFYQVTNRREYHYVPIDNLAPSVVQDGLPYPGCESGEFPKEKISDYIGGSQFLINAGEKFAGNDGISRILDMATGEKSSYVPGTSRLSWHAVLSPDGEQVAFMSQPKNGTGVDIYTMPLDGGDPVKVPTDGFKLSGQYNCENGPNIDGQCTILVDWR